MMSRFTARLLAFLTVGFALPVTAGCAKPLGTLIGSAPNRVNPFVGPDNPLPPLEAVAGIDRHFLVSVGPPEATLSASVIEPPAELRPPRATILVIHGIHTRSLSMAGTAHLLAKMGYRAVLVDLRGHGRSTGEFLTYGVQEAKDLSRVIDELERRDLVDGHIGVYGISYGATTSIHLAGGDPRVRAVVAVAPFTTMRDEVPDYLRTALPGVGSAISDETYQQAIDEAGIQAQSDPDLANAAEAIRRAEANVLIMHGTADWLVPPDNALRLRQAAPERCEVVLLPWQGHVSIWFDPTGEVAERAREWFDRWL